MSKYQIYCVFHDKLQRQFYNDSISRKIEFVNVRKDNNWEEYSDYQVRNLYDMEGFKALGKWYTESEVVYNIYKNGFYKNSEYVGFLQYDIDSTVLTDDLINEAIKGVDHIAFSSYSFEKDYNQKILMDLEQPNKLCGEGRNCYDEMILDFNRYYSTSFSINDLSDKDLNLCAAFLLKVEAFEEMMKFISFIIESGKLDLFDTNHKHRIQGGFLERYYAVWFILKDIRTNSIPLEHLFIETNNNKTWISKFLNKLKVWIKKLI